MLGILSFFPRGRREEGKRRGRGGGDGQKGEGEGERRWGYDFLCAQLSLPPFHFLPLFLACSQVLEICLEVVIDFQENFKGQYWLLVVCLSLLLLVCLFVVHSYVFTVFHVHRTSGPVLQRTYPVRTEGATSLYQLHCKFFFLLSFFAPVTLERVEG